MDILQLLNDLKNHYDWKNIKTEISNRFLRAKYLELNPDNNIEEVESDDVHKAFTYSDKKNKALYDSIVKKFDLVLKEFKKTNNQLNDNSSGQVSPADLAMMATLNKNNNGNKDNRNNKSPKNKAKYAKYAIGAGVVGSALYFSKDIFGAVADTYDSISAASASAMQSITSINSSISESVSANNTSTEEFIKDYDNVNNSIDKESKKVSDNIKQHNSNIENSNKKIDEYYRKSDNKKLDEYIANVDNGKIINDEISKNKTALEQSLHDEFKKYGLLEDIKKSAITNSFKESKQFESYYARKYDDLYIKNKTKNISDQKIKKDNITVNFEQLIKPSSSGFFSNYSDYASVDIGGLNQNNINFTITNMSGMGINNKFTQTAIIAKVYMETGYNSLVEHSYRTTDNSRLRSLFTRLDGISDAQLTAAKNAGDSEFYDLIYGEMYSHNKGLGLGNTQKGDAYKYRGRGFVGITGKNMYGIIGRMLGIDLISRPELLEDPDIAMKASIAYLTYMAKVKKIDINSAKNQEEANMFIYKAIGGKNILETEYGREEFARMNSITSKLSNEFNLQGGAYTTPGQNGNSVLPTTINGILPSNFIPSVYLGKPGLNYVVENNKIYYIGSGYNIPNKNVEYAVNSTTQLNGALLLYIHSKFPGVNVSSSWRTQAILGDGTKTDLHQYGAAIDIDYGAGSSANEDKIAKLLNSSGFLPHMTELIYSKTGQVMPNGSEGFFNIKRGQYFNYSPSTMQMHHNHIHAGWVPNHDINGWYNSAKSMRDNPPIVKLSDGNWYTRLKNGITKVAPPSEASLQKLYMQADSDKIKATQDLKIKEIEQNKKTTFEVKRNKEFDVNKAKSNFNRPLR